MWSGLVLCGVLLGILILARLGSMCLVCLLEGTVHTVVGSARSKSTRSVRGVRMYCMCDCTCILVDNTGGGDTRDSVSFAASFCESLVRRACIPRGEPGRYIQHGQHVECII